MRRFGLVTVAVAAVMASFHPAVTAAQELRGWSDHDPDYPVTRAMVRFGELVAQRTDGRIKPKTYPSAQLGDEDSAIEGIQLGSLDFAVFSATPLNNVIPETRALTLPYVFRDVGQMHQVVDGPIGADIGDAFGAKNMVVLGWYDAGARSFYTIKKPVDAPADLKGLKIRVQNSDLAVDTVAALGGNATPIPFGEVYTALQSGVVDGAENNLPSYEETRHFEIAKFYSLDEHTIAPEVMVVAKTAWDRLPPADQGVLAGAAKKSVALQRQLWDEREREVRGKLKQAGVTFVENVDKAPFQKLVAPLYAKYGADPAVKALVDRIQAAR